MRLLFKENYNIYYENTDASGFTYHTAYLNIAERSRSNLLIKYFHEVITFLKSNKYFFVLHKLKVNFYIPTYLYDKLNVSTYFINNNFTSLKLLQRFTKNDAKVCEIFVNLVWISGDTKKPSKIPVDITSRFKSMEVV